MAELLGTDDGEILIGDEGNDTLIGGRGADTLTGGDGVDLFVVDHADSSASAALGAPDGAIDVITDFTSQDRLFFSHALPAQDDSLFAGTAEDYDSAYELAQEAFADGYEFASVKVGSDVFVFAPRTDSVVRLEGVDPDQVTAASLTDDTSGGEDVTLGASAEVFSGGMGADTVFGEDGADTLMGGDGADRMFGGLDNDSMSGGAGQNYLRGDEGDDAVVGGAQHDDINGNMGRDTIDAGGGDDWVHGGKDDDAIRGGAGDDLVFGDLGDDTIYGSDGDDVMRGGEGQDLIRGDDGADTLMGDGGRDTLDGGNGADVFVAQAGGGDDLVQFFSVSDGDHVFVADGAAYSVAQEGDDVVITLEGGRMVLAGVQLSSLPSDWIGS